MIPFFVMFFLFGWVGCFAGAVSIVHQLDSMSLLVSHHILTVLATLGVE